MSSRERASVKRRGKCFILSDPLQIQRNVDGSSGLLVFTGLPTDMAAGG